MVGWDEEPCSGFRVCIEHQGDKYCTYGGLVSISVLTSHCS